MIVLGTFWSLLSIFHKHLEPSIFRIYGAHSPNKTCPQIKKQTNFIIRYDFYPSFPNPPITAKTLSQQMVPGKRFPMVKTNLCFCFFSHLPLYYPGHFQILWIILSKSLFWISLNISTFMLVYTNILSLDYEQAFHWPANRWTCPLYICYPE